MSSKNKKVTETESFNRWFGNSKVVDEHGKPMIVYHGTNEDFKSFDSSKTGKNFDAATGFYFFTNIPCSYPDSASDYAEHAAKNGGAANIIPAYVSLQNPLVFNADGHYNAVEAFDKNSDNIFEQVFEGGHDGVIVRFSDGIGDTIVAAGSAKQIKSAIGNSGAFDPNSNDMCDSRSLVSFKECVADDMECESVFALSQ